MSDLTQAAQPVIHYATTTATRYVAGTAFEHTLACGAVHWAIVTSDPSQVTCAACTEALAVHDVRVRRSGTGLTIYCDPCQWKFRVETAVAVAELAAMATRHAGGAS